jgi:LPXTG-motif cell wall-anchored protein
VVAPSPPVTLIAVGVIALVVIVGYVLIRRRRMKVAQTQSK